MKKENFWYVYVHTNKINGKKYIGITGQQRYWDRWRSDGSGYKTQVFGRAIEKYGWDNFSHDILDKVTSESKACELEQFYIQKYKTNQPEFGYNISLGGESTMTGVYNLPSISIPVYQYSLNGDYIAEFPSMMEAERQTGIDNSAICACCKGKSKTSYEYQWRFYFCDRINEISKLQTEKPILKLNRNGVLIQEYENVMQIGSEYVKTVRQRAITNIINCACGRLKTFDGYIWIFKDDYTNLNIEYRQKSYKTIPVAQYDKDNNYIQTFNSIADAQNYLNIKNSHISDCCSGKRQTDHGYIWKYVNTH